MVDPAVGEDENTLDSELVPSSLASIAPILRVANEIEKDNRRVAYLCEYQLFCISNALMKDYHLLCVYANKEVKLVVICLITTANVQVFAVACSFRSNFNFL